MRPCVSIPEQACGTSNKNPKPVPGIVPRRHVPLPPLTNPTPPVRRQHAAAAVVVIRPVVKSGPHAGEEKAPVKTPVMKVIVMKAGEAREGVAGKCPAADDMGRKHLTAETTARKSAARKSMPTKARVAGEAAKSAMSASATVTTTTATVTAPAAMRAGTGRPYRRAERNGRSERNARHLQPHESLTSLSRCCLFASNSFAAAPRIVIVASM
jgi:hypothetical protein